MENIRSEFSIFFGPLKSEVVPLEKPTTKKPSLPTFITRPLTWGDIVESQSINVATAAGLIYDKTAIHVVFVWSIQCGHCTAYRPQWIKLTEKVQKWNREHEKAKPVKLYILEASKEYFTHRSFFDKYEIEGTPRFLISDTTGSFEVYERNSEDDYEGLLSRVIKIAEKLAKMY